MAVEIRVVPPDALGPLKLSAFKCTPGLGDAAGCEAAVRALEYDDMTDVLVVAASDGRLTVGVATAVPLAGRQGTWAIPLLAVRIPWQGQKVGRGLKTSCLEAVRDAGGCRVVSSVHSATTAMHRINQTMPGVEWEAEVSGPGVIYSIDLTVPPWSKG